MPYTKSGTLAIAYRFLHALPQLATASTSHRFQSRQPTAHQGFAHKSCRPEKEGHTGEKYGILNAIGLN
ncbi:MAG: hypothetical protein E7A50_08380 [Clostridiales bacterium]|nr:hypothetical protein [Clostridiales bacterium]